MVTRKGTAVAFIAILIIAWLVVFVTQVEPQTTEEQKQALIGEWNGVWPGYAGDQRRDFYYLIHEEPKMGAKLMDKIAQVVASRLKGEADPIDL